MWILELRYRFYAGAVARELNFNAEMTDRAIDAIEDRVAALEEITAASWPRSAVLRRRLRRELRATDARYATAARDFRGRRAEWAADQGIISSQPDRDGR
jgi:hypothetical protein